MPAPPPPARAAPQAVRQQWRAAQEPARRESLSARRNSNRLESHAGVSHRGRSALKRSLRAPHATVLARVGRSTRRGVRMAQQERPRMKIPLAEAFPLGKMRYSRRRWSGVPMTGGSASESNGIIRSRQPDRKENHGYCQESCQEDRRKEARREEAGREEARREESPRQESCPRRRPLPRRPPRRSPLRSASRTPRS